MKVQTDTSRRLLACLSDASRFRIVRVLGGTERCVTEIAREVGLSQSCTTRHLQALGRDHIVRRRRAGKRVLFRLDDRDPSVRALLTWMGTRSATPAPAAASGPAGADSARAPAGQAAEPGGKDSPAGAPAPASPEAGPPERKGPLPPRPGDLEDYLL